MANQVCTRCGVFFQGSPGLCPSCKGRRAPWVAALVFSLLLVTLFFSAIGQNVVRAQDINEPTIDAPAVFYADEDVSVTFHVPSEATAAYLAVSSQIDEYPASCTLVAHGSGVNCNGNGVFTLSFHVQFDAQEVWLFNRAFFHGNQQKQVELYVPVEDRPTFPLPCVLDPSICTDIKVGLAVEPTSIKAGQTITATVTVTNAGPAPAEVSTSIQMPNGPEVNWVDGFAAGKVRIYTISVELSNSFTFTATAVSDRVELRPGNEVETATVSVEPWQNFLPLLQSGESAPTATPTVTPTPILGATHTPLPCPKEEQGHCRSTPTPTPGGGDG